MSIPVLLVPSNSVFLMQRLNYVYSMLTYGKDIYYSTKCNVRINLMKIILV